MTRSVHGHAPLLAAVAAVSVVTAAGLGLVVLRPPAATGPVRMSPSAEPASPLPSTTVQTATARLRAWVVPEAAPLSPEAPLAGRFESTFVAAAPIDAIDSALFDSRDERVRLGAAIPLARDALCVDDTGARFACGLMGRASLQNFVRSRVVTCRRLFRVADMKIVEADCEAGGEDLAEHQIRAGFAFPSPSARDTHRTAFDEARRRRSGVWTGPYVTDEADPAAADAAATPFGSLRLPPADPASITPPPAPTEPERRRPRDKTAPAKADPSDISSAPIPQDTTVTPSR